MPAITVIAVSRASPERSTIKVGRKPVATVSNRAIGELGLVVGMEWTGSLAARVAEIVRYEEALRRATALIARRPMSVARTRGKLIVLGHDDDTVARVIARLHELGLLDDEKLGRLLIEEWTRTRPAGPALIRAKLLRVGIGESLAVALSIPKDDPNPASRAVRSPGPASDALSLARREMAKRARVAPTARLHQVQGVLARRGFDADTILDVTERLCGELSEE